MSEIFFKQMQIPDPDINLEVGSDNHGKMTGEMLWKIEEVLLREKPDWVIVYGDTNSTLAGTLAASKLNIPVAHIEAGLRSYFRQMPEEQNRIVADHLSTLLFCPTETAKKNLNKEGINKGVHVIGDIMYDASLFYQKILINKKERNADDIIIPDKFFLLTLHRAENTDNNDRLRCIVDAINSMTSIEGIFPVHPRTKKALEKAGLIFKNHINLIKPVGFIDMIRLEQKCSFIMTDSGGVQKEAYFYKKPCITLRDQTEWIETVESGWNTLVGADKEKIIMAMKSNSAPKKYFNFYGTGNAGEKILDLLKKK